MKLATLSLISLATITLAQSVPKACEVQENACRTAPNANQAFCSAQRAGCDTYCEAQETRCRTAPNANQASCSAQRAGCVNSAVGVGTNDTTTTPPPPPPPPAVSACEAQENACRTAPNANQAFCSSQRAQCDASNPNNSTAVGNPSNTTPGANGSPGGPGGAGNNGTVTNNPAVPAPSQFTGAAAQIAVSVGGAVVMAGMAMVL